MLQTSISLSSQLSFDKDEANVIVHGSVIVKSQNSTVSIRRLPNVGFKSRTLSVEIDIIDGDLDQGKFVKPFILIERVTDDNDFDQVELTSNQDHHLVIDIDEPEEVYNDFSIERDLRQSILSAENRLAKFGSAALMSKGGSKLKDK